MYTITLNNPGGQMDQRTAKTPEEVARTVVEMITECGALYSGDNIQIEGETGDE